LLTSSYQKVKEPSAKDPLDSVRHAQITLENIGLKELPDLFSWISEIRVVNDDLRFLAAIWECKIEKIT
jgi:hypothetical protein